MRIMVTGGAGYIGSHMVKQLLANGDEVHVVDDLSNGHRDAIGSASLHVADVGESARIEKILGDHSIELVMHFASKIEVGESVRDPAAYYDSIVGGTLALVSAMRRAGCTKLVYSSTAAIYGEPETSAIAEDHPRRPESPYGRAKSMVETLLDDFARAYGFSSISLRYFNAAGAANDGSLGERHDPETHLVPLLLQAALGKRDSFRIFGTDYETPDGTCVRDFVHIEDICAAHHLAVARLVTGASQRDAFNLGNGSGFSVREVVETVGRVTGRNFQVDEGARRPGDPAILVADSTRAKEVLGWTPRWPNLDDIVTHAWAWERELPAR